MALLLAMPTSEPKVVRGVSQNGLIAMAGEERGKEDAGTSVRTICFLSKWQTLSGNTASPFQTLQNV